MPVFHPASDLSQPQLAFEQAHFLIGQNIGDLPSTTAGGVRTKARSRDSWITALAIGQQIKSGRNDLLKEFRTEAATIEHDGHASLAHQSADLIEDPGQHLDQTSVGRQRSQRTADRRNCH